MTFKKIFVILVFFLSFNLVFSSLNNSIETKYGISLNVSIMKSDYNNYYSLDELVHIGMSGVELADYMDEDVGIYDLNLNQTYPSNFSEISLHGSRRYYGNEILGTGGSLIDSYLYLEFNHSEAYKGTHYKYGGIKICNEMGGCSPLRPNGHWVSGEYTTQVNNGFMLTVQTSKYSHNNYYSLDELTHIGMGTGVEFAGNMNKNLGIYNLDLNQSYPSNFSNISLLGSRKYYGNEILGTGGNLIDSHLYLEFNHSEAYLASHNLYGGIKICNEMGGCSPMRPTSYWNTGHFTTQANSGILLTIETSKFAHNNYYSLDELVNTGFSGFELASTNNFTGTYDLDLTQKYPTNLNNISLLGSRRYYGNEILGTSGSLINSHLFLDFIHNGSYKGTHYDSGGIKICNEFGGCSPMRPNSHWVSGSYTTQVNDGIMLKVMSQINKIPFFVPTYLTPTPANNQRSYDLNNISIKFYDGDQDLNGCYVNINGLNYSMNYSDTENCIYTYSFVPNSTPYAITFKGFYNVSGSIMSLQERTIFIYPSSEKIEELPVFGFLSIFLFVFIFIFFN